MKKVTAEFAATYALVLIGPGAAVVNNATNGSLGALGIGIAFGGIIMIMIYTLGRISGAQMNPAVSLGFTTVGVQPLKTTMFYAVAQFAGAIGASITLRILFPDDDKLGSTLPSGTAIESFWLELMLTFLLMMVVLFFSQIKGLQKWAGLAIGFTVFLEAWLAGPICGASMNPARSLGPALISGHTEFLGLYLTATTFGALWASLAWNILPFKNQNK